MKTIKQIADEIGVTKQSVQKRISREPLYTRLYPCISTNKGIKYIDVHGENIIKSAFLNKPLYTSIDKPSTTIDSSVDSKILDILQENIKILQTQLTEKDKQIADLTETLKAQAHSINADRHSELAIKIQDAQKLIEDSSTKPSFGERIKFLFKGKT